MNEDTAAWDKFLYVLDWVLAVQSRYVTNLHHSLIRISFHEHQKLGNAYGAKVALQMLIDLAKHLRTSLRKADLVARDGTSIWVLIPFVTNEAVLAKVAQIIGIAADNGLDIVDRDLSIFPIPDAGIPDQRTFKSGKEFLAAISNEENVAMRWDASPLPNN